MKKSRWIDKYQIQVYSFVLVLVVAGLALLIVWASQTVKENKAETLSGLSSPPFQASSGTITSINFADITWNTKKNRVYKLKTDFTSNAISAAAKLGFEGSPHEDKYRKQYSWSNSAGSLTYAYDVGDVMFSGSAALSWADESSIKAGVSDLFGIDTSGFELVFSQQAGTHNYWEFSAKVDDLVVLCEGSNVTLFVETNPQGDVAEFHLYLIETTESTKIELYDQETTQESFSSLPKQVTADVYPSESCEAEGCYMDTIPNPSGSVEISSAEIVMYRGQLESYQFLVPVLELNGQMTTSEEYSGGVRVLVDIIDWEALQ